MPEKKPSNPKDALGIKKVPLHTVPSKPLLEVALAMMEGSRKYGSHNYREIGVRMSTYYDAAMRHLISWWEGEDIDPDSGVHHLIKAIASLFVVRDGMFMGNCVDDRPIRYPSGINMDEFNEAAAKLISTYPECAEPFLEVKEEPVKQKESTEANEPADDEERSLHSARVDGKLYCDSCHCFNRGFPKKGVDRYYCPKHSKKETNNE